MRRKEPNDLAEALAPEVVPFSSVEIGIKNFSFYPDERNKGLIPTFQPLEEGWSVQRPKRCDKHGDKDEDNSVKNINDVHNTPSQKYRRILEFVCLFVCLFVCYYHYHYLLL